MGSAAAAAASIGLPALGADPAKPGMAGLFLVGDDEDAALGLPGGEFDLPLVIQDRLIDGDNQFVYPAGGNDAAAGSPGRGMGGMMSGGMGGGGGMMGRGGMASMMAGMMGVLGDRILVNGSLQGGRDVERRAYRLRLELAGNASSRQHREADSRSGGGPNGSSTATSVARQSN